MSGNYSTCTISGLSSHYSTNYIRLPLKYEDNLVSNSSYEKFNNDLSNRGRIIQMKESQSLLFNKLSWSVSNDLARITMNPIDDMELFNIDLCKIEIELPHSLASSSCLSVAHEIDESGGYFVVDMIDENFLFITVKVYNSDFVRSQNQVFSIDRFHEWGKISIPYSFELRSAPFSMWSINPLNYIVSLKDGGLLHFQRTELFHDFTVHNLHETVTFSSLGISSFFKRNNQNDTVVDGISLNSIVDLEHIKGSIFLTLSVGNQMKLWDYKLHEKVSDTINLAPCRSSSDISHLSMVPAKYLRLVKVSSTDELYVTTHFLAPSDPTILSGNESRTRIGLWKIIISDNVVLLPMTDLNFEPTIPSNYELKIEGDTIPNPSPSWYIQDMLCYCSDVQVLNYYILWKSNTTSNLIKYSLDINSGIATNLGSNKLASNRELHDFSVVGDVNTYKDFIFNWCLYDQKIFKTSLQIISSHIGYEEESEDLDLSPFALTTKIIDKSAHSEEEQKNLWSRLYSLCEEFRSISEESISMYLNSEGEIYVLNVYGVSFISRPHYFQKLLASTDDSKEGKLALLFSKLSMELSTKSYLALYDKMSTYKESELTSFDTAEIYTDYIQTKYSSDQVSLFLKQFDEIPEVLGLIQTLIDGLPMAYSYTSVAIDSKDPVELTTFLKIKSLEQFRKIKQSHEYILINLAIILLLCESNEVVLNLISKIINRVKKYATLTSIINTGVYRRKGITRSYEHANLNKIENSLFWESIANNSSALQQFFWSGNAPEAYDYFYEKIFLDDSKYIVESTVFLMNSGDAETIKSKLLNRLEKGPFVSSILYVLTVLLTNDSDGFYKATREIEPIVLGYDEEDEQFSALIKLGGNDAISEFIRRLQDIISSASVALKSAKYYNALAHLSKFQAHNRSKTSSSLFLLKSTNSRSLDTHIEDEFMNNALNFETAAIESLKKNGLVGEKLIGDLIEYNSNLFDISLELSKYELIYRSLIDLEQYKHTEEVNMQSLFRRLLRNLIQNGELKVLFAPNDNQIYMRNYTLIDSILLEIANSELTLSESLRIYQYIYSWRLFGTSRALTSDQLADKRRAIEALYIFITRFKSEKTDLLNDRENTVEDLKSYKLKILELYMIMLNCLKTFESKEDRWLVKSQEKGTLSILTLDSLLLEYSEWLKGLEVDLS